jgi:uncharacterized protein
MRLETIINKLREAQSALAAEGVAHLAVVGSRARQEERSDSDLDILLDIDADAQFSLLDLIGVQHIAQDATGIEANAFIREDLKRPFLEAMEADEVRVF